MTSGEARAHYNFLLTLCLRKEESFGPLALTFIKDHDLERIGLTAEEQFNLYLATAEAFAAEPKRYTQKLECLQRALQLLQRSPHPDSDLLRHLNEDIQKTTAELEIYNDALRASRSQTSTQPLQRQRLIIETDFPDYFLNLAQKRAGEYFQSKYKLPKESKTAQHFGGPPKKFEPENAAIQKEFAGACAPFMAARTNAFHMMLPFDVKISRKPDDPLEAGVRIFYTKIGYSYPLRYAFGRLCSYHDGTVLDLPLDDPHLLFVSYSPVKEHEMPWPVSSNSPDVPPEFALPQTFLEHTGTLGTYVQVSCNVKVWFDSAVVNVLIQGAPDLNEYGLMGGAGLMTRTYASDKTPAYVENFTQPWQEGLSFNFVNLHLQLLPGVDTGMVPYNTPIFSVYPVLSRQCYRIEDRRSLDGQTRLS